MPTKSKKPLPKLKKIYVTSQLLCSDNLFNEIKDLCERAKTSYRKGAPSVVVKDKKFKPNCELIEKDQKLIGVDPEGAVKEITVPFKFWDEPGFFYYIQPKSLPELETFILECDEHGFDVILRYYDPEQLEDFEEKWLAENIGLDLPEEPFGVAILQDEFLLDQDGVCDCPECQAEREQESDEED